jgi:peptidoglycan/LPS O-acetylase OafA/YrhL
MPQAALAGPRIPSVSASSTSRAYRTLDGLRGVAALVVVTRHAGDFFPGGLFPESFLAVDLFFLLSGFVVAHAYEARLLAGRSLAGFLKTRLIRLYPLYALGIGLGFAAKLTAARLAGQPVDAGWLWQAVAVGLVLAPAVPPLPMGSSALDGPTWTLAPELVANLLYARTLHRLRGGVLWAVIGLGAAGLVASELVYGSLDGGWSVERFPLIAARLAFSFFLGVAMFRARPERRVGRFGAWACLLVGGGVLMISPAAPLRQAYELGVVLLVFPAVMATAVRLEPGARSALLFHGLGVVSYALYVLHQPLGVMLAPLAHTKLFSAPTPLSGVIFMVVAVALAAAADRFYDAPVRRWLNQRRRTPERIRQGVLERA